MSHAITDDVETILLREMTPQEAALATKLLALAAGTLRRYKPTLDEQMTDDADFAELVNYVEASAVARVLRNPEGYSYEMIGAFSVQRPVGTVGGGFAFTNDELQLLGISRHGAFTIRPYMAQPTPALPAGMPPWWYDFPTSDGSL